MWATTTGKQGYRGPGNAANWTFKMKSRNPISPEATALAGEELYEMANLFPRTTGLPMTVWLGPRGNARHDVRIKVNMTHGNQMNIDNAAVVGIRPVPHLIVGRLSPDDRRLVFEWIGINAAAIIGYWDGSIDTAELIQTLKRLLQQP